jgi:formylmethanofuran dehydrogenase subunit E
MTKPRRAFGWKDVLLVLIYQCQDRAAPILCHRCGKPITIEDVRSGNVEREHLHERELGGPDEPENCRYSHKARPCHAQTTNGTPATSAGSSKNRIAKATHPNRTEKFVVRKPDLDAAPKVDPGSRCRRCGEYLPCACPAPAKANGFGRKQAVRA